MKYYNINKNCIEVPTKHLTKEQLKMIYKLKLSHKRKNKKHFSIPIDTPVVFDATQGKYFEIIEENNSGLRNERIRSVVPLDTFQVMEILEDISR